MVSLYGECLDKLQIQSESTPLSHGRVFSGFPSVKNKLFGAQWLPSLLCCPVCAGPAECSSLIRVSVLVTKDWCLSVNTQAALFLIPRYCFSPRLYLTDPYLPPSFFLTPPLTPITSTLLSWETFSPIPWCQEAQLTSYCLNRSSFFKVTSPPSLKALGGRTSCESHKLPVWSS